MIKYTSNLLGTFAMACMLSGCIAPNLSHKNPGLVGAYGEKHAPSAAEHSMFNDTYKGKVQLTPQTVATQVVAGTNYRFDCKNPKDKQYQVVIYKDLPSNGGRAEVTSVKKVRKSEKNK